MYRKYSQSQKKLRNLVVQISQNTFSDQRGIWSHRRILKFGEWRNNTSTLKKHNEQTKTFMEFEEYNKERPGLENKKVIDHLASCRKCK